VVDKVALGQGFLRVLRLSPVNIIPPLLRISLTYRLETEKGPVSSLVARRESHFTATIAIPIIVAKHCARQTDVQAA
jgi:hypothetical protein